MHVYPEVNLIEVNELTPKEICIGLESLFIKKNLIEYLFCTPIISEVFIELNGILAVI